MKKLISAASALAMAASMAGAAVPFTTGAAEASKTMEIRTYLNPDGSAASDTIDCSKGDVTVPIAMYYVESTPDTRSIRASMCISAKGADPSSKSNPACGNISVEVVGPSQKAYKEYFDTAREVSGVSARSIPGWCGKMSLNKKNEEVWTENGNNPVYSAVTEGQASQNIVTPWCSAVWAQKAGQQYVYTNGESGKSDDYPVFVFNATFAKGTPAGTYVVDFVNMAPDPNYPEVLSTMIEGTGEKYTIDAGNLITKSLEITVKGDGTDTPQVTTTKAPVTTPATTTKPVDTPPVDSGDKVSDFVVEGGTAEGKPGEEVTLTFKLKSHGSHLTRTLCLEEGTLPAGITSKVTDENNYCYDDSFVWELSGDTWYCQTFDSDSSPVEPTDGEDLIEFTYKLPDNIANGEYKIDLARFHVVENGVEGHVKEWDATVIPGTIKVSGGTDAQVTTTKAPTTTPATTTKPVDTPPVDSGDKVSDFVVEGKNITAKPGETVKVAYSLKEHGSHLTRTLCLEEGDLPAGITSEISDENNYCYDDSFVWELSGDTWYCQTFDSESSPVEPTDGEDLIEFAYTIPADIKPGSYTIDLARFHVVENGVEGFVKEWDATVIPTVITIEGETVETTTAKPVVTTTTAKPVVTTTTAAIVGTTTTKAADTTPTDKPTTPVGDVLYGDVNVDKKVNIADVVVLNKWLNKNDSYKITEQGKINANCCDVEAGKIDEKDSLAIIQSIVHLNDGKALPWTSAELK